MTKSEIVQHLTQNAEHKAHRGNAIWTVQDNKIFFHEIFSVDEECKWETKQEGESTELSCPLNYLDMTEPVDPEWRKKNREYNEHLKSIRLQIRQSFQRCKHGERVKVKLGRPGYRLTADELIIEDIKGRLAGRGKDLRLYRVNPRLVQEIKIIKKEPQ
jgi:dihydroneopterin aldolase